MKECAKGARFLNSSPISAKVSHGEVRDLGPDLGIYVLAFRDPDNIQIELTAPYA